jgi:hypothetical protein
MERQSKPGISPISGSSIEAVSLLESIDLVMKGVVV